MSNDKEFIVLVPENITFHPSDLYIATGEIVRCKDCKYYKEYISNRGSAMMCLCPCCIGGQGKKKPTDYCSYGEREE